jgi:integrase
LKTRRSMGEPAEERPTTLGVEIDGFLDRARSAGGLRPRSIEFYEQKAKVWLPLREVKVSALRRALVQDFIVARAAKHPRSAQDELQFVKRVLREAKERGQRVDDALFSIKLRRHEARRGRGLRVDQLYELASWFPEHVSRLVLIAGQVGSRQAFWFSLTDDMLDLDEGTMPIPAELSKNKRDHRVYLTSFEVALFREQLLARAPGTRLVFPTATGKQWDRSRFREQVWSKSLAAAVSHDRERSGGAVGVRGLHLPHAPAHGRVADGTGGNGSGCGIRASGPHGRRRAVPPHLPPSVRGREAHASGSP